MTRRSPLGLVLDRLRRFFSGWRLVFFGMRHGGGFAPSMPPPPPPRKRIVTAQQRGKTLIKVLDPQPMPPDASDWSEWNGKPVVLFCDKAAWGGSACAEPCGGEHCVSFTPSTRSIPPQAEVS